MKRFVLLIIFLFFITTNVWAVGPGNVLWPNNYHYARLNNLSMLSPSFVYSMPIGIMEKGKKELKVVPVYLKYNGNSEREYPFEEANTKGWSLGGTFLYAFKDWFGVSVMAAFQKNSGKGTALSVVAGGGNPSSAMESHLGDVKGNSSLFAVNCIFNLMKGKYNFRLPLLVGLGMSSASAESTGESIVTNSGTTPIAFSSGDRIRSSFVSENSGMGVNFGIAPQIDLGKNFRANSGVFYAYTFRESGSRHKSII